MADPGVQTRVERFLPSGDEAGTAPGDRPFRPDVEGLRAVAVLLVVLYHSGISFLGGGFIGVDVFFVISGFVITGVLLRERETSGRNALLAFYGRRCRRIIPAASLVIVATVALTYGLVGSSSGGRVAGDGRWASVFLANFHFAAAGTDYLVAHLPPSPLQNFWSLGVEEQFYVVFPTLFLVLASLPGASVCAPVWHSVWVSPRASRWSSPSSTRRRTPPPPTSRRSRAPGSSASACWWRWRRRIS